MQNRPGEAVPGTEGGAGPGQPRVSSADPWPWNFAADPSGLQRRSRTATWARIFRVCIFPFRVCATTWQFLNTAVRERLRGVWEGTLAEKSLEL